MRRIVLGLDAFATPSVFGRARRIVAGRMNLVLSPRRQRGKICRMTSKYHHRVAGWMAGHQVSKCSVGRLVTTSPPAWAARARLARSESVESSAFAGTDLRENLLREKVPQLIVTERLFEGVVEQALFTVSVQDPGATSPPSAALI